MYYFGGKTKVNIFLPCSFLDNYGGEAHKYYFPVDLKLGFLIFIAPILLLHVCHLYFCHFSPQTFYILFNILKN